MSNEPGWERALADLPELERHAIERGIAPVVSGLHERFRPYLVKVLLARLGALDTRGKPLRAPSTPPWELQTGTAQRLTQQAIANVLQEVHAVRAAAEEASVQARRERPPSAGWRAEA